MICQGELLLPPGGNKNSRLRASRRRLRDSAVAEASLRIRFEQRLGTENFDVKLRTVMPGGYNLNHRQEELAEAALSG